MKIAQIVPHFSPYSEKRLVGIKRIVYILFTELSKRGHKVSIIAPSDSDGPNDKLLPTIPSLRTFKIPVYDPKSMYYGVVHASKAAQLTDQFDLIHSHAEQVFLPFIPFVKKPVISTIHGTAFSQEEQFIFKQFKGKFTAIGISKQAMKVTADYILYSGQIYNGVNLEEYRFNENAEEYMFLIARINPYKGILEAVEVANKTGKKLILKGYKELSKEDYYQKVASLSHQSKFVDFDQTESFDLHTKTELYSKAKLFLFPVTYEETFASTIIESMASGTPVVAFARGSLPEQVIDGETGFLVNPSQEDMRGNFLIKKTGVEGLREAVERIYTMPQDEYRQMRQNSRKQVEDNFTVKKMVDGYERVYKQVMKTI